MKLRKSAKVTIRPYHHSGYGSAFAGGSMCGAFWGVFERKAEDEFSLAELRAAWTAYRDEYLAYRHAHWPAAGKAWAELVFDDGMDPDAARDVIAGQTA